MTTPPPIAIDPSQTNFAAPAAPAAAPAGPAAPVAAPRARKAAAANMQEHQALIRSRLQAHALGQKWDPDSALAQIRGQGPQKWNAATGKYESSNSSAAPAPAPAPAPTPAPVASPMASPVQQKPVVGGPVPAPTPGRVTTMPVLGAPKAPVAPVLQQQAQSQALGGMK